ncbi:sulfotransferase family 2 domain-containing protein [Acetobacter conturbans]|uniref:Chondroitin 4-O-sulfotransferase n=1 Tax=Acetobacter conturbans TaxID=1737472 RepID=A0ABX0K1M2_9PROT|nr:sulfotransferase family 2 domain-containing protein [Acetobacter conturbans]NHN89145.1 chondroitin 4-O-sulfotransferase [Acetobacter conturbans]
MIVLEDEKTIILHTPKCGGKALRQAFSSIASEGPWWDWTWLRATGEWVDQAHVPLDVLRQTKLWDYIENYTIIAVVRDPLPRFMSSLAEHMRQHRKRDVLQVLDELDEVRISHDPRYIHFIPQNRFTHTGNKRRADFIVRTESLPEDLRAVGMICGMSQEFFNAVDELPPMPRSEKKSGNPAFQEKILSALLRFYKRDYILFGYSCPEASGGIPGGFDALLLDPLCGGEWNGYGAAAPAYERFVRHSTKDFLISQLTVENRKLREKCQAFHAECTNSSEVSERSGI